MAAPTNGVLYALVARGPVVLCEYSLVRGNAPLVALSLLEKWQKTSVDKASFVADRHVFHIMTEDGITYGLGRQAAFAFLEEVRAAFRRAHGPVSRTAIAYELNTAFEPELRLLVSKANADPRNDLLRRVQGEMSDLKSVMVDSIDKILDRGERLDVLVDRTEDLATRTLVFKREARRGARTLWWAAWRMRVLVAALCTLGLYALVALVCSPTLHC